jgi:putative glutamine amidotransferase
MPQPIIAITTKRENIEQPHITIWEYYVQAVIKAGGLPVLLPVGLDSRQVEQIASQVDGILISGGGDIDPDIFNGKAHSKVYDVNVDRDRMELELVRLAREKSIPLLGICRGLQVINVAKGGTLYTDLDDQFGKIIHHSNKSFTTIVHTTAVQSGTRLAKIVEPNTLEVNSLHHQGIECLGSGLIVNAIASDGLVEGVETDQGSYLLGVQWHPEALSEDPSALALFSSLISAAAEYREKHGRK